MTVSLSESIVDKRFRYDCIFFEQLTVTFGSEREGDTSKFYHQLSLCKSTEQVERTSRHHIFSLTNRYRPVLMALQSGWSLAVKRWRTQAGLVSRVAASSGELVARYLTLSFNVHWILLFLAGEVLPLTREDAFKAGTTMWVVGVRVP